LKVETVIGVIKNSIVCEEIVIRVRMGIKATIAIIVDAVIDESIVVAIGIDAETVLGVAVGSVVDVNIAGSAVYIKSVLGVAIDCVAG